METSYINKPYFFVPLIKTIKRHEPMDRQNMLNGNTGILNISITCVTPLHFGSGHLAFDEVKKQFSQTLLRENVEIALPGSSFKGMLRSVFEALTESCLLNTPKQKEKEPKPEEINLLKKVGNLSACERKPNAKLCPACSVFGRLSNKGKLTVGSFRTNAETIQLSLPALKQPFRTYSGSSKDARHTGSDPHTGNERLYYGKFKNIRGLDVAKMSKAEFWAKKNLEKGNGGDFYGRKFYKHSVNWEALTDWEKRKAHADSDVSFECLCPGAVLEGQIIYQGLTDGELAGLLFALGLGWEKPIYHKLGYAKPVFLGSVKLSVSVNSIPRYNSRIQTDADAEELAKKYYNDHENVIGDAVRAFEQEWAEIGRNYMWVMQNNGKFGY